MWVGMGVGVKEWSFSNHQPWHEFRLDASASLIDENVTQLNIPELDTTSNYLTIRKDPHFSIIFFAFVPFGHNNHHAERVWESYELLQTKTRSSTVTEITKNSSTFSATNFSSNIV